MAGFSSNEIEYAEEIFEDTEQTDYEVQQDSEKPASPVDPFTSQAETLVPLICRIAVEVLNRFSVGRVVLRAMERAKLKRQEQHIKAQIKEMVNQGEFTVVSMDVLDELDDSHVCTVEVECQQVDESFQPGDVIHNLVY